ncbi:MAG: C4-dicarboxylate ABC transporter substrate-binding protein, partial [Gammaproteobacteria bacterium]|nr:C4-dicarboxylate ABC transporter substrate-binding protein [Gammaproteobacteria bacterium]
KDVSLLAATTSLLARDQTHPALRQLFAQSAQTLHSGAGWFNQARDFPNTRTSELPVSPEGDRAINGTPPFWQRYLPFWASNLVERMWLVLGGLLVLMLPLSRVVPPLYQFRVRRRVFRWYARLREIEAKVDARNVQRDALARELDELDRVVNKVAVPLSYADELYALRNNIFRVRQRVLSSATPGPSLPPAPGPAPSSARPAER